MAGAIALTLSVAGCSTKGGSTGAQKSSKGGIKTDFGVTDSTINLGMLVDESGVFKVIGIAQAEGSELWADDVNAAGGVCGRQIKIETRDDGYNAEKAVTLYAAMKGNLVGMLQVLGSPIVAALKSQILSDNMLSIPASWATGNLASPAILQVGSTYAIEMINAMSYVQKQGLIKDGDKLGIIYITGEYGGDGLLGAQHYVASHNQTLVPIQVTGDNNDMSSAITQLKSKGVSAVLVTTTPVQMGSAATQMAAQGLGALPLIGVNPTFDPTLLQTPAKSALGHYYRGTFIAPFDANKPITQKIAKEYEAKYKDPEQDGINIGYSFGLAYQAVLERACKDKDMTRQGLMTAARKIKVDTQGLTAPLDYSKQGDVATRSTFVEQVDPAAKGSLKIVQELNESPEAKSFNIPSAK